MPSILIITTNDAQSSLQTIDEGKDIQRLLDQVFNKNYSVKLVPNVTTTQLVAELGHLEEKLEVLHYCGHANSSSIQFTDRDVEVRNLAARLKSCPNLKLVFLNGCQTKDQVQFFHEAGIPHIIATTNNIEDKEARWLSAQFYKYMVLGNNIDTAFDKILKDAAIEGRNLDLATWRDTASGGVFETDFEWGLYTKDNAPPYSLPFQAYTFDPPPVIEHGQLLSSLLLALKKYRSPLNKTYLNTIEAIESQGNENNETKFIDLIKILPYPVGIRLRQIYAPNAHTKDNTDQYYRELLHDYACFFETLLHYSFAILFSQIWQNRKTIDGNKTASFFEDIQKLIRSNRLHCNLEDYAPAIKAAHTIISITGVLNPIPHINDVFDYFDDEEFKRACGFFDLQKNLFRSKIRLTEKEAIQQCYTSQRLLEQVFPHFGFIIENVLASVRYINVINFRYVEEAYASEIWELVASEDGAVRTKRFKRPLENKSVLFYTQQEFDADTPSINLFPFYLDRSAFSRHANNVVDLYQFMGYFQDEWIGERSLNQVSHSCYYFMSLSNPNRIWCFDERDFAKANFAHIDEERQPAQALSAAGELNTYFEQFKSFLEP